MTLIFVLEKNYDFEGSVDELATARALAALGTDPR